MEVRGWSEAEKAHAARIFARAEASKHPDVKYLERLHFVFLLVVVFFGNLCFITLAFPVILFASLGIGIALLFLLGVCMGLLFVHALRSLNVPRLHHVVGFIALLIGSLIAKIYVISALQLRFRIIPDMHAYSAVLIALPYIIGMAIPYVAEQRLHGTS